MNLDPQALWSPESAPILLQLTVTLGLAGLCAWLNRRYRRRYFALWTAAWIVYAVRLVAIMVWVATGARAALFWHQVTASWTAVAFLWAAVVFAQRAPWRSWYSVLVFAPVVWSFAAVYLLDDFIAASVPVIAFLSATTAAAAWAFLRYDRLVRSSAARFLAAVLALWAVHHLDYLFLRASGLWNPWGYYLDIGFQIAVGLGILMLVLEDLDHGLDSLTSLSGELLGGVGADEPLTDAMLRRALSLRGVHGSALWLTAEGGGRFLQGAGVAALWPFESPPEETVRAAKRVASTGKPEVVRDESATEEADDGYAYSAALPVLGDESVLGALVVVGEARDPFTVLDSRFLLAFGQQVGAALANDELHRDLSARTSELERLQARMVHQHEEERNRIWRELHDETAQVLAALNLQLGVVAERSGPEMAPAVDRARTLLGQGIQSIRSVTRNLRPLPLDDLGLLPALRALARDFDDADAVRVTFDAPESPAGLADLGSDAESALYRAMQEGVSNAVRHGARARVDVRLTVHERLARLTVLDDGPGFAEDAMERLRSHGGLAGIRERVSALGGHFTIENRTDGGASLQIDLPLVPQPAKPVATPNE